MYESGLFEFELLLHRYSFIQKRVNVFNWNADTQEARTIINSTSTSMFNLTIVTIDNKKLKRRELLIKITTGGKLYT